MSAAQRIRVRGQVQGVGFRPFVWQLAQRFGLRGAVWNDPEGVVIEAQGAPLAPFLEALRAEAPPLARIDGIESAPIQMSPPPAGFEIAPSRGQGAETRVTPDAATCPDCLADLRGDDPRRRDYAFTNCTHCGPRFTILEGLPYDRARTTMAGFAMCPDCAAEYGDPGDRRFHAQPVACATCGPQLRFEHWGMSAAAEGAGAAGGAGSALHPGAAPDPAPSRSAPGDPPTLSDPSMAFAPPADPTPTPEPAAVSGFHAAARTPAPAADAGNGPGALPDPTANSDPLAQAVAALRAGAILAIKGLGGFHLCCDATNPASIARLRARKRRLTKPLALMGRWDEITGYAAPSPAERAALGAPAAPILLLDIPAAAPPLPEMLAPGQSRLGWMLPYTPLHHLLLDRLARPLVMTSGNLSGEPQVIGAGEARAKLGPIADGMLDHDRPIARRLDDSVMQITAQGPMVLRRARGLVPTPLPLPPGFEAAPQITAYGAHLKSAICLIKQGQALLSHHLGDLDDALSYEEFLKADADYSALFDHRPSHFACDLHPDYRASQHASDRAAAMGTTPAPIPHHHAHLAACLGENLWPRDGGPVVGVICDGLGLGPDGTIWGGEILLGDYDSARRVGWLRPVPLLGGDGANREPWRNGLAQLDGAGLSALADRLFPDAPRDLLRQAARSGLNAPLSSSAGRLFDAVAAVLGAHEGPQSYEGEAAMALESLARRAPPDAAPYPFAQSDTGEIDPRPLWQAIARDLAAGTPRPTMALRFHRGLAQALAAPARALVERGQAKAVALSGGCFQSALLQDLTIKAIGDLPLLRHALVPPNDGGLALGQALIAAAQALSCR